MLRPNKRLEQESQVDQIDRRRRRVERNNHGGVQEQRHISKVAALAPEFRRGSLRFGREVRESDRRFYQLVIRAHFQISYFLRGRGRSVGSAAFLFILIANLIGRRNRRRPMTDFWQYSKRWPPCRLQRRYFVNFFSNTAPRKRFVVPEIVNNARLFRRSRSASNPRRRASVLLSINAVTIVFYLWLFLWAAFDTQFPIVGGDSLVNGRFRGLVMPPKIVNVSC